MYVASMSTDLAASMTVVTSLWRPIALIKSSRGFSSTLPRDRRVLCLKYVSDLKKGVPILNEKAIEEESRKDGFFGVITNIPSGRMGTEAVVASYKHLWIVEDAFGAIKGELKARPVYHWTDNRIRGHLTMCFLAYFCEAQITKALREREVTLESEAIKEGCIKSRPLTVMEVMHELAEVRAVPVKIRDSCIWVRTDIKGNAARLFSALKVPIPAKILGQDDTV